jgi:formylglycine-generating enzyme required for sulfatase activity
VVEAGQPLVYTDRTERQTQDWRDFPISGISWDHVQHYLEWLRRHRRLDGADLCTEEQWERAARGADDRMFPHGNVLSPTSANIDETYGRKPAAFGPDVVGSHEQSISPFGVHDMAGNVWEMTRPGAGSHTTDPPDGDVIRTRGGSFFHLADNASAVNRWVGMSGQGAPFTGFRVCASAPVE